MCVSKDKRWIATADFGPDAMIVVWDALRATPVKIIPQSTNGGVAAMDMSADAMFLATISYNYPQTLAVWEWPAAHATTPAISAPIGNRDYQHCVRFNPVDVRDLVSNGAKEVIFWNWNEQSIAAFHPPKGISKLKKAVRNLSQTTFIPYTTRAVTATTSGHIIAWDYPVSELVQSTGRDAIKILKLVKSGINLIDTVLDKFIVCGCADGAVRFFDFQFRVVAWFEDIQAGHITSISFADQNSQAPTPGGPAPAPAAQAQAGQVSMEEFSVSDFVVGTSSGKVLQLDSKTMEHLTPDKRRGKLLIQGFDDEVHALDAHPSLPLFAVGTAKGSLQIWDVDDRKMVTSRKFEVGEASSNAPTTTVPAKTGASGSGGKKTDVSATLASASAAAKGPAHKDELINDSCQIQCLKFGPRGLLALGFANGFIKVVSTSEATGGSGSLNDPHQPPPLRDVCSFHRSEKAITNLVFSADGSWVASSDAQGCVAVYRFWHKDDDMDKAMEWIYVGKYRAHYKPIIALFFEATSAATPAQQAAQAEAAAAATQQQDSKDLSPPGTASSGSRTGVTARNNLAALAAATLAALAPNSTLNAALRSIPRLYSLGEDDLKSSSIRAGLKICSSTRLEQTACPTAMMSLPGRTLPATPGSGRPPIRSPDLIITANDEYKLKVWEISSNESKSNAGTAAAAAATAAAGNKGAKSAGSVGSKTSPSKSGGGSKVGGGAGGAKSGGAGGKSIAEDEDPCDPTAGMSPSELEEHRRDKKCRKTLLAPMYGGSINKLFNLPKRETPQQGGAGAAAGQQQQAAAAAAAAASSSSSSSNKSGIVPSDYLVYSTFDKIVGLIKLPLDGNPTKSMAVIAHPGEVSCVVATFDGKYLVTAGGSDRSVNLWSVSSSALDASITLGSGGGGSGGSGSSMDAYMSLIEGGRDGAFMKDLVDYFTYGQLRAQGLATTKPRDAAGKINVVEAINLMRALGFYPTEQQVVAMKTEVRYENQAILDARAAASSSSSSSAAAASSSASRSLDLLSLDDFLKLYLNHRPVFGLGARAFEASFASLGGHPSRGLEISSERLVHQLMTLGEEPMSMAEIEHCLDALLGERFVPQDAQDVSARNGQTHTTTRSSIPQPLCTFTQRYCSDSVLTLFSVLHCVVWSACS